MHVRNDASGIAFQNNSREVTDMSPRILPSGRRGSSHIIPVAIRIPTPL